MRPGKGSFVINGKELDKYFASKLLRLIVEQPLKLVDASSTFDYKVNIYGGGLKGQAEAIRLAVARALVKNDEETSDTKVNNTIDFINSYRINKVELPKKSSGGELNKIKNELKKLKRLYKKIK